MSGHLVSAAHTSSPHDTRSLEAARSFVGASERWFPVNPQSGGNWRDVRRALGSRVKGSAGEERAPRPGAAAGPALPPVTQPMPLSPVPQGGKRKPRGQREMALESRPEPGRLTAPW